MARRPQETPRAYTERSPWRYVRTVRLVKTLYLNFLTYGGDYKDITERCRRLQMCGDVSAICLSLVVRPKGVIVVQKKFQGILVNIFQYTH